MKKSELIVLDRPMRDCQIEELYAFIAVNEDGKEGICAFGNSPNEMHPMVFSDPELIENMKKMAKRIAGLGVVKIKFMKFTNATQLEMIEKT